MKSMSWVVLSLPFHVLYPQHGAGVGLADFRPINMFDVQGSMAVGEHYAGQKQAPPNGLLVQGQTGIGLSLPGCALDVSGQVRARDTLRLPGETWHAIRADSAGFLSWEGPTPVVWSALGSPGSVVLSGLEGSIAASGHLQSDVLASTGQQLIAADSQGRLVPGGSGILTQKATYQWQAASSSEVWFQVYYGQHGHQNQWQMKNNQGQVVAGGGGGPSHQMAMQQQLSLAPGAYLLEAWDAGGDGWQGGYLQLVFGGGQFGPVQPTLAYHSWLVQVPVTQVAVPVQEQAVSQKLLRGHVGGNGLPITGGGFEVRKTATGVYQIRFLQAFSDVPVVMVSRAFEGNGGQSYPNNPVQVVLASPNEIRIETYDETGLPEDRAFTFLALGSP